MGLSDASVTLQIKTTLLDNFDPSDPILWNDEQF